MTQNAPAHTPGPWTWRQAGNHFEVNSDTRRWSAVATVATNRLGSREVDHSEAAANARLIAAAPDLLAALQDLIEENDHFGGCSKSSPAWDAARQAVQRAIPYPRNIAGGAADQPLFA